MTSSLSFRLVHFNRCEERCFCKGIRPGTKKIPLARVREGDNLSFALTTSRCLRPSAYVTRKTQLLGEEKPEESAFALPLVALRRLRRYLAVWSGVSPDIRSAQDFMSADSCDTVSKEGGRVHLAHHCRDT